MRKLFLQALTVMTNAFSRLESHLDPPEQVPHADSFVYRYREKGIPQALIQKLARNISGLNAIDLLLLMALYKSKACLQRTLDEIHEDIFFLASPSPTTKSRKARAVSRSVLRRSNSSERLACGALPQAELGPTKEDSCLCASSHARRDPRPPSVEEVVSAAYSGYVHAASPHIMDMYGGDPPTSMWQAWLAPNGSLTTFATHGITSIEVYSLPPP